MPKRKEAMTVAQVNKLGPGNHRVGGTSGLTLQVSKSGQGRSWTLRYSDAAGKRREIGIGSAFDIPLAMARDMALELRQKLKQGVDPLVEKARRREAAMAEVSFSEAIAGYLKTREGTWGNEKHQQQFENTLDTYAVPLLGKLPVSAIAPTHVAQALAPIWVAKAETARRVRQRVEAVIAWADGHANRARTNPAALAGLIATGMLPKVAREVESHAAMPWREVPAFMVKLRQAEGVAPRALELAVLCASRSGEVRGMTWGEVDLDAAVWTIPAARMKAGREHAVPLAPAAVALLKSLPQGKAGDLVFPGLRGQLSDMALLAVLKRLKVDVTVHGFRSSFRDWCGDSGHDRQLAELSLAHAIGSAVEQAYARSNLLERRRTLMNDWASHLGG